MANLAVGDIGRILSSRIANARADLRRAQDVAAAEFVAMQAQINELEAARDALTADREAFILQLQKIKVLPE